MLLDVYLEITTIKYLNPLWPLPYFWVHKFMEENGGTQPVEDEEYFGG